MAKKFFGLGILVMVLVFGMLVIGCSNNDEETYDPIFFDYDIIIENIPNERNGEKITISIVHDGKVRTSKTVTIAKSEAKANLKITEKPSETEFTYNVFGDKVWVASIVIKIGSDPSLSYEDEFEEMDKKVSLFISYSEFE